MTLDLHWLINGLLSLVLFGIGWFCRELWSAVQKLRSDLSDLEVSIGKDYVRYDRLQDALKPLARALERIEEALNHKVDK